MGLRQQRGRQRRRRHTDFSSLNTNNYNISLTPCADEISAFRPLALD